MPGEGMRSSAPSAGPGNAVELRLEQQPDVQRGRDAGGCRGGARGAGNRRAFSGEAGSEADAGGHVTHGGIPADVADAGKGSVRSRDVAAGVGVIGEVGDSTKSPGGSDVARGFYFCRL